MNDETSEQRFERWDREAAEREALEAWEQQTFTKVTQYVVGFVVIVLGAAGMFLLFGVVKLVAGAYGPVGIGVLACVIWLLCGTKSVGRGTLRWLRRKNHVST